MNEQERTVFRDRGEIIARLIREKEEMRAALATLVALKDGPRDDAYALAKPLAWERARLLVYGTSWVADGVSAALSQARVDSPESLSPRGTLVPRASHSEREGSEGNDEGRNRDGTA